MVGNDRRTSVWLAAIAFRLASNQLQFFIDLLDLVGALCEPLQQTSAFFKQSVSAEEWDDDGFRFAIHIYHPALTRTATRPTPMPAPRARIPSTRNAFA